MAEQRLPARRRPLRHRHRPQGPRCQDGRPAALRPDHPRRPPVDGQVVARHQYRLQRRQARVRARGAAARGSTKTRHDGAVVGFFSLEMSAEQLATRILSEQAGIPSEKIRRGMIDEDEFKRAGSRRARRCALPALHRPDRRHLHRPAGGARPPPQAPAGLGLIIVDYLQLMQRLGQARATTACRRSPRSPPASRRWPRS